MTSLLSSSCPPVPRTSRELVEALPTTFPHLSHHLYPPPVPHLSLTAPLLTLPPRPSLPLSLPPQIKAQVDKDRDGLISLHDLRGALQV
jgi:hypothetical protein